MGLDRILHMIDLGRFRDDERGAVTVDWVVLTAAIVFMGIAVTFLVAGGVPDLANAISSNVENRATGLN